jgi:threonylcarbamoyladenosine tRNA methylthiotransferase MtaB
MENKRLRIVTLGCKVNQYESAYLEEALARFGWRSSRRGERADLVLINTCIVTGRASYQSRQAIKRAARENPGALIGAVGCYAQVFPEELRRIPGLHLVAGNTMKGRLPRLIEQGCPPPYPRVLIEPFTPGSPFEQLPVARLPGRTRAFLKIQDGCDSPCTYCIVPRARGGPRSLPPERVLSALSGFASNGFKEVVLTGIHLGRYGLDLSPPFSLRGLLENIGAARPQLRVRLSSLDPDEVLQSIPGFLGESPWLCRHFHIALQSGDNRILRRMGRRYRAEGFARTVESVKKEAPFAAVGADVLVGFPGETEEAFGNTLRLLRDLPVSYLHVFRYSPRPGTPAARFSDQVPQAAVKERSAELRALGRKKWKEFHFSCLGGIFPVLVEGCGEGDFCKGLADNYLPVAFPSSGDPVNEMVEVRVERLGPGRVEGRAVGSG